MSSTETHFRLWEVEEGGKNRREGASRRSAAPGVPESNYQRILMQIIPPPITKMSSYLVFENLPQRRLGFRGQCDRPVSCMSAGSNDNQNALEPIEVQYATVTRNQEQQIRHVNSDPNPRYAFP